MRTQALSREPAALELHKMRRASILNYMADSSFPKLRFWKKITIKEEDRVTLPSILGIKPPHYLAVLYGAALLFVLFLVLVYPGLSKPGAAGICNSEPQGAAVRVDNVTLGYTPCVIFIPQGQHTVEFVLPGFETDKQELKVRGRIFASLFFPSRINVSGKLFSLDPAGAFALAALDYMYWSAAGDPTEAYQIPMRLSEGAYRTAPAAKDPSIKILMQGIVDASLRHAVSRAAARDLLRAHFLLNNNGLSPSPLAVISGIQHGSVILGNNSSSSWLADILSAEAAGKITQSLWYKSTNTGRQNSSVGSHDNSTMADDSAIQGFAGNFRFPGALNLEGVVFTAVEPGFLEKHGRRIIMPPMLVARYPVSKESWDIFTREIPEWDVTNRDILISRGIAGEDYLNPVIHPAYPEPAAPGISWYAAEAFCAWLNARLPPSLEGWEARLPGELEWEYAAQKTEINAGLLWEWCYEPYAALDFFPAPEEALKQLEKASALSDYALERVLRGGSWINPPGSTGMESRGSLPPETSSPFAGFRPVIVPKQGK